MALAWIFVFCGLLVEVAYSASGPQFEAGLPLRQSDEKAAPKLWPRGKVPYSISSSIVDDEKIRLIRQPMRDIEQNTCIRFVSRKGESDYLNIQTDRAACSAQVGQQTGINQLNLANACYDYPTIALQLLYVLGLYNENNRADRETFVEVNLSNINGLNQRKFEIIPRTQYPVLDTPYDIKSLTHFSNQDFGRKKAANDWTIRSRKTPSAHLGNSQISSGDYQKLNNLYCGGSRRN